MRKVERPLPWALYGAMLAGAAYVLVGAGSPDEIPAMIEKLSRHEPTAMSFKVYGSRSDSGNFYATVRPEALLGGAAPAMETPKFLAIVSSFGLADALAGNPATRPYGFVVESSEAGGHSAAPAKMRFDAAGQPLLVYTEQDQADIGAIAGIGLPSGWRLLRQSCAPARSQALGASGVQSAPCSPFQASRARPRPDKVMKLLAAASLKSPTPWFRPQDSLQRPRSGHYFRPGRLPGPQAHLRCGPAAGQLFNPLG